MPITEEKALEVFVQLINRVGLPAAEGGTSSSVTLTDATTAYGAFLDTHNKQFPAPVVVAEEPKKKSKRKRRGGPPAGWPVGVGREAYAAWEAQQKKKGRAEAEITPQQFQREDRAARAAVKRGEKVADSALAAPKTEDKAPAKTETKAATPAKTEAKTESKAPAKPAATEAKAPAKEASKVAAGTAS